MLNMAQAIEISTISTSVNKRRVFSQTALSLLAVLRVIASDHAMAARSRSFEQRASFEDVSLQGFQVLDFEPQRFAENRGVRRAVAAFICDRGLDGGEVAQTHV
jgi:hypothetical protein